MRRTALFPLALLVVLACPETAYAQDRKYPTKPIRIIQGFSMGGISDTLARVVGDKIGERLGQPVIVESRPGGGGIVGMTTVAQATPDGYTLLLGNSSITISPSRKEKLPFDPLSTFVPVSMIGFAPSILLANPSTPVSSIRELIAYAKARPGKVDCATSGIGTTNDLGVHLLNVMAGIHIQNVPYKGSGPSLTAAMGNETRLSFSPVQPAIPFVQAGKLKALGVSSVKRNQAFPDVPAIAETLPGYEVVGFFSIVAHRDVPRHIIELLHKHINAALTLPDVQSLFDKLGLDVSIMTRQEFAEFIAKDAERWTNLVRDANLSL
jgi:tripartite-type tricarboxylate transporter receptor subunit TctC